MQLLNIYRFLEMAVSPRNMNYNRHANYYKSPINIAQIRKDEAANSGEALSWRSAYKKRCLEETKKSRQKLLCKFRNLQVLFVLSLSLIPIMPEYLF